jgi:hydroxymethylbilane synthase
VKLITRKSRLALAQAHWVQRQLGDDVVIVGVETAGDRRLDASLQGPLAKGWFTAELETALRDGTADFAVHSLKDLPVEDPPGLVLAAIPARFPTADVLLVRPDAWADGLLPVREGATVGASSARRQAQLRTLRPDLRTFPLRGNVPTRIRKLREGELDAIVLAEAGLRRMGGLGSESWDADTLDLAGLRLALLDPHHWPGAAGQGALALQCRAGDEATLARLAKLHDPATAAAVHLERRLLSVLGGGCAVPLGAWVHADGWTVGVKVAGRFTTRVGQGDAVAALQALLAGGAGAEMPARIWTEM